MAGFYTNLPTSTGSDSVRNIQSAISGLAQIQKDTRESVTKNLNGIGEAIKDYAQYRIYKDKTQRDEEFRQKEFDEKSRQFNVAQDNQMTQHREKLDEQKRQWNEGEANRKAEAALKNAQAWEIGLDARKKKNTLNAEEANDAAELKRRKEAEKAAQKQKQIADELNADSQQATANTKSTKTPPIDTNKVKKGLALVGEFVGVPAPAIERLF